VSCRGAGSHCQSASSSCDHTRPGHAGCETCTRQQASHGVSEGPCLAVVQTAARCPTRLLGAKRARCWGPEHDGHSALCCLVPGVGVRAWRGSSRHGGAPGEVAALALALTVPVEALPAGNGSMHDDDQMLPLPHTIVVMRCAPP
jgi:hypothetical protein